MASNDPRVTAAIDHFTLASDAEQAQRQLELDDLNFVDDPDGQWPADVRRMRESTTVGGIPVPARPCLTLDQLDAPIQQTVNTARNARLAVQVSPKGGKATQDTAEMIQGLYRNIEVESNANAARIWALERAAKCGRGFYRILTQPSDEGNGLLDITIKRILNQGTVYLDPFYQEPDASDMRWALVVDDIPFSRYKRKYPKSELATYSPGEFVALGADQASWVGGDEPGKAVRVAEHFYLDGDLDDPNRVVKWCLVNAIEVLEERTLNGRYIPIVQVIGKETNVNGVRRFTGIVRKAKDPQRILNYMATKEVETVALAPQAPYMAAEGQFEGYERQMAEANLRGFPYMYYKPTSFNGNLNPPPTRNVTEPAIQAISLAKREAREDVHSTTGVYPPSLGNASYSGQSGKAIQALQGQTEQGTSNYLDSLASVSMPYEARVILDMLPDVYDTPGRIVRILTGDTDASQAVMVNQPFTQGPQGPQPAEPGTPGAEHHILSREARYGVVVSVGKSFATRRQEAADMMGSLAEAVPQLVPLYADLWVRNQDFPGKDEIADRFHDMLPPQILQKEQGDQQQADPQMLQQQLQQLQQQVQQLQPLADDNQAKLQLKQLDLQQTQMTLAQKDRELQATSQLKAADIQSKEQIAQLQVSVNAQIAQVKAQLEAFKITAQQQQHADSLHAQSDLAHTAQDHDMTMAAHEVATRPEPVSAHD